METILREVLAEDRSLLCRRDELTAALEKKVPPDKSRDFAAIKRALSLNVGEKFFVGEDSDREATKTEVAKILKEGGLQEARINFVVDAFVKALDWDKPKVSVPEKTDAAPAKVNVVKAEPKKVSLAPPSQPQPSPPKPKIPPKPQPSSPQPPPPQSTYQPPPQQATANQSSDHKKILIGVACVAVLALGFMVGRSLDSSTPPPPQTSSASNVQQTEPAQNSPPSSPKPPPEDTSYLNARTDLSLNGMDLSIPISEAERVLGRPSKIEKVDGYDRYIYSDNFYIAVINGKVDAFVTSDPKFKTKRGLHAGSTYSEVVDKYGTNSRDMTADDLVLHEYPFTSLDGKYSLLRFAVNSSGRVDYISIRIAEEAPSLGEHWIKNTDNVYLWNPQPQEGESITWSGGSVQDGNYKFAEGPGVVRWYNKNGELVQVDEGNFKRGQRHGKFKHSFRSGKVEYITWDNGKEVSRR